MLAIFGVMGKLKACFSQNIDGFERDVGIKSLVELHGTLRMWVCTICAYEEPWILGANLEDIIDCPSCETRRRPDQRPISLGHLTPKVVIMNDKVATGSWSLDGRKISRQFTCYNIIDQMNDHVTQRIAEICRSRNRLVVLVMGTSLPIHATRAMLRDIAQRTESILVWVNLEPPPADLINLFQYQFLERCEIFSERLVKLYFARMDFKAIVATPNPELYANLTVASYYYRLHIK
jgi:NAD-dependent SIR2 family protein deacetylase